MTIRGKIAHEWEDEDGYWIALKSGWRMPGDSHQIVETTKGEARGKLKDAVRCDCDECREIKAESRNERKNS